VLAALEFFPETAGKAGLPIKPENIASTEAAKP
jgi:hypothetical protein